MLSNYLVFKLIQVNFQVSFKNSQRNSLKFSTKIENKLNLKKKCLEVYLGDTVFTQLNKAHE